MTSPKNDYVLDEENLVRQAEEIEALASIYGDDWCTIDASSRCYSIKIAIETESVEKEVNLQVSLPAEYPKKAPPLYQINAPWLRGDDKLDLCNALEDIFVDNIGENIIYLWVEQIREFTREIQIRYDSKGNEDKSAVALGTVSGENCSSNITASTNDASKEELRENVEIYTADTISDRKSTFQPFLANISNKEQVTHVLDKLLQNKKIANATHNIYAYRIQTNRDNFVQGCEDDGETHAGGRLLHLLQIVDARNVIVVVSRWYGGIHLGPDRFKHINNCARKVLEAQGFITTDKDNKKTGRSKKGK